MKSHYLTLNQERRNKQATMENQWSKSVSDDDITVAKKASGKFI